MGDSPGLWARPWVRGQVDSGLNVTAHGGRGAGSGRGSLHLKGMPPPPPRNPGKSSTVSRRLLTLEGAGTVPGGVVPGGQQGPRHQSIRCRDSGQGGRTRHQ